MLGPALQLLVYLVPVTDENDGKILLLTVHIHNNPVISYT